MCIMIYSNLFLVLLPILYCSWNLPLWRFSLHMFSLTFNHHFSYLPDNYDNIYSHGFQGSQISSFNQVVTFSHSVVTLSAQPEDIDDQRSWVKYCKSCCFSVQFLVSRHDSQSHSHVLTWLYVMWCVCLCLFP